MTVAASITPHLPYLRRYARALTGTQSSGDAYVAAVLEAVLTDPDTFPRELPPKVALFRVFASIWQSVSINLAEDVFSEEPEAKAQARLQALAPRSRQAFLLSAVEGFATDDIAMVLATTPDMVSELIDEAGRDIADQVATDVLIIEDEPLIALDIEQLVQGLGHRVTGIARTHQEALAMVRRERPGLVLADIQLADGSSGIDAVNDILKGLEVPVIFITAFPERLLTGEKPEPAYLVTKPFEGGMVRALISQALFFDTKAHAPPVSKAS